MKKPTYYITTPLYYPSGKWHLGHSYTTVCCDAIARYKRMSGYDVFYLTGTDEHGQKIAERAAAENKTPKQFVDELTEQIKQLWDLLDISYDGFIRTTDEYHKSSVQAIFKRLYDQGDIYKGKYKGKYCLPCEAFWQETQLKDGKCPDCGREVTQAEEDCYFFRLSAYSDRLLDLLTNTDFLQPKSRAKEMVNNFIKPGLADLAVSRASVKWGIPVSFDQNQTVYVWIDALSNYINALGYNNPENECAAAHPSHLSGQGAGQGECESTDKQTDKASTKPVKNDNLRFWPADVHMVGKEIVRFHAIVWPALLFALDLPLPKRVYGHGWLLFGGDKMSKSKGNTADPFALSARYGVDALRYYLLREIPFGSDGVYTDESFLTRINSDLVNDLGNLVKRTVAMASQYFGGKVSFAPPASDCDSALVSKIEGLKTLTDSAVDGLSCSRALEGIFELIGQANKYIDENAPWTLNKNGDTATLNRVLYILLEAIRVCACLLCPFLTRGAGRIFAMLGQPVPSDFSSAVFGAAKDYQMGAEEILYQRLDIKKELAELNPDDGAKEKPATKPVKIGKNDKLNSDLKEQKVEENTMISIDEFYKTELRVAEVIAAEKVEKADKLLKLTVRVGDEERTVVSGIAQSYTPDEMIGKRVVLVANLKPAKIRGIESFGMLLCASHEGKAVLIAPETIVDDGSLVG